MNNRNVNPVSRYYFKLILGLFITLLLMLLDVLIVTTICKEKEIVKDLSMILIIADALIFTIFGIWQRIVVDKRFKEYKENLREVFLIN